MLFFVFDCCLRSSSLHFPFLSCSPPARCGLLDLIRVVLLLLLLLLLLLHHLCSIHFKVTSALPTLRQALRQLPHAVGTAGPQPPGSERTGHRWTSTRDLPSPVGTAGPQPGTFRAQWAPLDLNLGPSELSGHRWTSTVR